jgi:hypothetical protein
LHILELTLSRAVELADGARHLDADLAPQPAAVAGHAAGDHDL